MVIITGVAAADDSNEPNCRRRRQMKRTSLALSTVLGLLVLFTSAGVAAAQTGSCIYLGSSGGFDFYYDSSSVRYNGTIVSYAILGRREVRIWPLYAL